MQDQPHVTETAQLLHADNPVSGAHSDVPQPAQHRSARSSQLVRIFGIAQDRAFAVLDKFMPIIEFVVSHAMFVAGPLLILLACGLISFVLYYGFLGVIPLYGKVGTFWWFFHGSIAIFLAVNILFNYISCVMTNPGNHKSPEYARLIAEARAKGDLPRDPSDDAAFFSDEGSGNTASVVQGGIKSHTAEIRNRGEAGSSPALPKRKKKSWIDRGPFEWGYCTKTNMPKAPRSHYDHVTGTLVLNMDHYCPWMFNPVGYLNYRFFWLFLMWIWLGCVYSALMTTIPFLSIQKHRYVLGIHVPRRWKSSVSFIFIICASVGIAVTILFFYHVYLILTAQTTIEFYGNRTRARRARARGEMYRNPYDLGALNNFKQVFGPGSLLTTTLPSLRSPPWPPWPSLRRNVVTDSRLNRAERTV